MSSTKERVIAAVGAVLLCGAIALAAPAAAQATVIAPQSSSATVGADRGVVPTVHRDCGLTGCKFYFNKSETKAIRLGSSACAKVAPLPVKPACVIMRVTAIAAAATGSCVGIRLGPGGNPFLHNGKYCR